MNYGRVATLVSLCILAGCGGGGSVTTPPQAANSVPGFSGVTGSSGKTVFVAWNAPTILAYDQASMTRVGQIKTSGPNVVALALSPDARTLYAAVGSYLASCSNKTTSLLAVDAQSMTPSKTVQLTGQITDLKESNNGSVLVAVVEAQAASDLYVFDPKSLSVIKKIALPAENFSLGLVAVSNDGSTAFVAVNLPVELVRADITSGTTSVFHQFSSSVGLVAIALDPLDHHVYAGTFFSIPIFDTVTGSQTGSIGLGSTASLYANFEETTDKRTIVVGGLDTNNLAQGTVIDSASAQIIKQFMVNSLAFNMGAVNSAGTEAFFYTRSSGPPVVNAYNVVSGAFVAGATIENPNAFVISVAAQ